MTLVGALLHRSVTELVRVACVLTLVALAIMAYSVLVPGALPVILAMSVGHLVGGGAFVCFFVAVVLDAAWRRGSSFTPPAPPAAPPATGSRPPAA